MSKVARVQLLGNLRDSINLMNPPVSLMYDLIFGTNGCR